MTTTPTPGPQFEIRTAYLAVPELEWAAIKHGGKTEFRAYWQHRPLMAAGDLEPPYPVILHARGQTMLRVLEETWREALGGISSESLRREGFPDFAHFRRYWMERTSKKFPPLTEVQCFRVRAIADEDAAMFGRKFMDHLYGHA